MKGLLKTLTGAATLWLCIVGTGISAGAATGIYVGKDVSAEGTTIVGVSTEADIGISSIPVIYDKGLMRKGDVIESDNGYVYELPEDSAKMTLIRMMGYTDYAGWANVVSNEYGVSVIASITSDTAIEAQQADPFVSDGINEGVIAPVLCATSKSAEEAVDLLCSIYDDTGAMTTETVFITDPSGAWVVENFTGHQYVAAKLPDDRIATFSNDPVIKTADPDREDMILSSQLLSLPEENDFAVYDKEGSLDLILTYNYDNSYNEESHLRGWVGHDIFAASEELDFDPEDDYDVFFTPDGDVGIKQAFAFFRNRFEGTAYDLADADNRMYYGINNQLVANVSLIQVFDDVPAEMSSVIWTTPANPTASPFIPVPALADTLPDSISTDVTDDIYTDGVLQFDFAKLNSTVYPKRDVYGASIRHYWEGMEAVSADDISGSVRGEWKDEFGSSPAEAAVLMDDYISKAVEDAADDCARISDELDWYLFRNGIMSSTVPDDEQVPFECSFDAVAYARANGWDTSIEDGVFVATKGDQQIEVVVEGDDTGNVTFIGFDSNKLIEDFLSGSNYNPAEEEACEPDTEQAEEIVEEEIAAEEETTEDVPAEEATGDTTDADEVTEETQDPEEVSAAEDVSKAAAQQLEVDTIAAIEQYFGEKIQNVPRDGWAENEIARQINSISYEVVGIVGKYFDGDVEDHINMDYEKVAGELITDEDVAELSNRVVETGIDLSGLLERYFLSLYEDVIGDVESGRLTQQGAQKILEEAEYDVVAISQIYIEAAIGEFSEIFNTDLSPEEYEEIFNELSSASLGLLEDYGVIDLDALGLGDIDINSLSEADIDVVITLNEMDDDVLNALSAMTGIDVRGTIDLYMDAINNSGSRIRVVEENHESETAQSAPDPVVIAAIEQQEELAGDDVYIPQEVIDVLNEAIIEAAKARGEEIDESMLLSLDNAGSSPSAPEEAAQEAANDGAFTTYVNGVRSSDGKVMLPAFMLRYFN